MRLLYVCILTGSILLTSWLISPLISDFSQLHTTFHHQHDTVFQTVLKLAASPVLAAIPAFPGAEGFGANTIGGRGGTVIEVKNLNDAGPGSLRAALETTGPRTVIFRTGGTIRLSGHIEITNPFVTVAGQTAPGDGILIRGGVIDIATHDVIIRGLRVRMGDEPQNYPTDQRDGIGIVNLHSGQDIYNVILDHNSVSWGIDENISIWSAPRLWGGKSFHDISIQWNITSEALYCSIHPKGCHSMGLLVGDRSKRISIHHNLYAHNNQRNPLLKGDTQTEVVNNLIYDWGGSPLGFSDLEMSGPMMANIIGNYFAIGPSTRASRYGVYFSNTQAGTAVYVQGNIGPTRSSDSLPEWSIVSGNPQFQATTHAVPPSGISTQTAVEAKNRILAEVGATIPSRDPVDQRIIQEVAGGTGKIINSQSEVGGWPALASGTAPQDTDHDGMPDNWEQQHQLDSNNPVDGAAIAPSGYTWLEEYINSLFQPAAEPSPTPTLFPSPTHAQSTPTTQPTTPPSSCNKANPVQFSCYGQWYLAYNAGGNPSLGDFDGDGRTSLTDYERWRRVFIDANTPAPTQSRPTVTAGPSQPTATPGSGAAVNLANSSCLNKPANRITALNGPNPLSFNAIAGQTYDARGQIFTETVQSVSAGVIEPKNANDVCVVGPTLIGPLDSSYVWESALKPDGIQWNRPVGRHELHGAWIRQVNDALSPPKGVDAPRDSYFIFRDIYAREIRDDVLENDSCLSGEIHDSLFDGVFMGFSSRPGTGNVIHMGPAMPVVRITNTMLRLTCQTDNKTGSSCPSGSSHGQWFKMSKLTNTNNCTTDDGRLGPRYHLTNVILRADHIGLSGIDGLFLPEGTYENVKVLYTGPGTLPAMPPGVTVVTNLQQVEQLWNGARNTWLTAHGCDSNGNNCTYLRR